MVNTRVPTVCSKTYVTPRRPYEKARLDQELKIIGEYGLRNKREVWRVKLVLAHIRKAARELLTLEEKDQKRLFEGDCLTCAYREPALLSSRLITILFPTESGCTNSSYLTINFLISPMRNEVCRIWSKMQALYF